MTTDDFGIVEEAYSGYDSATFGIPYCYLPEHSYGGMLGNNENLFISAHGNNREIGNENGPKGYTPQQLKQILVDYVFPGNYGGRVYVSACGSAPVYVNNLLRAFGAAYNGRIFGIFGDVDYAIDPPGATWVTAV
ncbi:MAG TPA: hypothetical protein VLJ57_24625 [Burkholderiaceae bacterium]|nr:hypothetical protein [Burkholderiaceae bacterium]